MGITIQQLSLVLCFVVTTSAVATVNMGSSASYVVLSKTGITANTAQIIGDVGTSPAGAALLTGFSQTISPDGSFATSPFVTGKVFAGDYAGSTPQNLKQAVSDMEITYNDAAGRPNPDFTDVQGGVIATGTVFAPGVYRWTTAVTFFGTYTFSGSASDVFIMQVDGAITFNAATKIILQGVQANNIFWQVTGAATVAAGAVSSGNLLAKGSITLGANTNYPTGRIFSQTFITLSGSNVIGGGAQK